MVVSPVKVTLPSLLKPPVRKVPYPEIWPVLVMAWLLSKVLPVRLNALIIFPQITLVLLSLMEQSGLFQRDIQHPHGTAKGLPSVMSA